MAFAGNFNEILTSEGWVPVRQLLGAPFLVSVDGAEYAASGLYFTGHRPGFLVKAKGCLSVEVTYNQEIFTSQGWAPCSLLKPGMKVRLPSDSWGQALFAEILDISPTGESDFFSCITSEIYCLNVNGLLLRND